MGKYKLYTPDEIASVALGNLLEKIPEMEENYRKRMDEFAASTEAQERYMTGVASWIGIMRRPEIRKKLRETIRPARDEMDRIREMLRAKKVPVKVTAR